MIAAANENSGFLKNALELAVEWMELWGALTLFGLVAWAVGLYKVMVSPTRDARLSALYGLTAVGYTATWMAGWLVMKSLGYSVNTWWIVSSILFGLVSVVGSFMRTFLSSKGRLYNGLAVIGYSLAIASVVTQTSDSISIVGATITALIIGGLAVWLLPATTHPIDSDTVKHLVVRGFKWMAWAEGATVLILFLLYMPAKRILGINLDGGTGLIGWTHGIVVLLYVLSLTLTFRELRWTWLHYFAGGFASFFPFGTLVFERKMFPKSASSEE